MTDIGRVYAGRSEPERRAERRGRLLAAGLEQFGTDGWHGTTIERLCSEAGVATRSFYEEFPRREALLLAVYDDIMTGVVADVIPRVKALRGSPQEQIRTALAGYVDFLTADPRRAKIAHREVRMAGGLEPQRQAMVLRFAALISSYARLPEPHGRLLGLALAGAVAEVLVDWVAQPEPRPPTEPLVEVLESVFSRAMITS